MAGQSPPVNHLPGILAVNSTIPPVKQNFCQLCTMPDLNSLYSVPSNVTVGKSSRGSILNVMLKDPFLDWTAS